MLKVWFIDGGSTDEFQLTRFTKRCRLWLLPDASKVVFIEVFLDEHQGHVAVASCRNERSIRRPVQAGQGPRNQASFKRAELVDQRQSVALFHHQLYVRWRRSGTGKMQWYTRLRKHLREARVCCEMQLWIGEHRDSRSGFLNVYLSLVTEGIVRAHADDER